MLVERVMVVRELEGLDFGSSSVVGGVRKSRQVAALSACLRFGRLVSTVARGAGTVVVAVAGRWSRSVRYAVERADPRRVASR